MSENENSPVPSVFMFSYHEHDWEVDGEDEAREEVLRRAANEEWTLVEGLVPKQVQSHCDESVQSLDDLEKVVRAFLVEEWGMPAEAVTLPIQKARDLLAREGFRFVSGSFDEMEGNHNDSEIYVVVEKA